MEQILGLMVTEGLEKREELIKASVTNFFSQTYKNKKLLIFNQGKKSIKDRFNENIEEHFVEPKAVWFSRIEMHDLIDENQLCIQWDDDDLRSENMLEKMYDLIDNHMGVVAGRGYYYNLNTNKYKPRLNTANVSCFLFRKKNDINYDNCLGEDQKFYSKYSKRFNIKRFKNKDDYFIKLIHGENVFGNKIICDKEKESIKIKQFIDKYLN